MINYIISECKKLAGKTKHDRMEKNEPLENI